MITASQAKQKALQNKPKPNMSHINFLITKAAEAGKMAIDYPYLEEEQQAELSSAGFRIEYDPGDYPHPGFYTIIWS